MGNEEQIATKEDLRKIKESQNSEDLEKMEYELRKFEEERERQRQIEREKEREREEQRERERLQRNQDWERYPTIYCYSEYSPLKEWCYFLVILCFVILFIGKKS